MATAQTVESTTFLFQDHNHLDGHIPLAVGEPLHNGHLGDRRKWPLWRDGRYERGVGVYDTCFFRGEGGGTTCLECQAHDYHTHKTWILYVAQVPAGTSMRPLKTKTQFLRRPFQFSVNEVFRMKAEHFSFKMKVLASLQLAKQLQKVPFCSGE